MVPVVTSIEELPDVKVSDFSGYLQRMAPYRTFFAENALELLEKAKDGEDAKSLMQVRDCDMKTHRNIEKGRPERV